jgi:hypothetical protein
VVALRLFELLPRHPVVTVASVMKLVETTRPTAGRALELLVAAGVLVETTGKKRDRSFGPCGEAPPRAGDRRRRDVGRFAKSRLKEAAEPPDGRQSSMWEEGWPSIHGCTRRGAGGRATSDRDLSVRPREGSVG